MSQPQSPAAFDELDPHGSGAGHHGHVIMSGFTLRAVLAALLALTALTVGAAQLELWAMDTFAIEIPRWVNVAVAMSIATIKAGLVVMFFMQLKYDNPINTVVFMFTLLGVGLFLGFTLIDMGSRGAIDPVKVAQISRGGTGNMMSADQKAMNMPIAQFAAQQYQLKHELTDAQFAAKKAAKAHGHAHHTPIGNTADQSRGRTGLTPGLFDAVAPAATDPHNAHEPADAHAPPAPSEATPVSPPASH